LLRDALSAEARGAVDAAVERLQVDGRAFTIDHLDVDVATTSTTICSSGPTKAVAAPAPAKPSRVARRPRSKHGWSIQARIRLRVKREPGLSTAELAETLRVTTHYLYGILRPMKASGEIVLRDGCYYPPATAAAPGLLVDEATASATDRAGTEASPAVLTDSVDAPLRS
jgi:hypothetical protein